MANNRDLAYGADLIQGVNSDGTFSPSKANTIDINLKPYKIVQNGDFVYNPSRLNIGAIAYRREGLCIVSHLYVVFHLNEKGEKYIIPEYLYLYFRRDEFFRQITFLNFGSQRPEFNFFEMSDIRIPLPSMEVQRDLIATYEGLKRLAEDNEALIAPLTEACQAFIVDCKRQYPSVPLGEYIEEVDERNTERKYSVEDVRGISIDKIFIDTKANMEGVVLTPYKLVKPSEFCYVSVTSRNGDKISLAANSSEQTYIVSSSYEVFRCKKALLPKYIYLLLSRSEFDRYARFNSWGSARESFSWEELCRVQIPLPPLEVQQSIVNLYHCMEEAKSIAREARESLATLCPTLVQYAIEA
ncbi:restriction endonuclease subunit S [uncultured Porphyromonas sp.]|uniref:restriction endonuclease subunit S n=1 Tax=uncultured Porphyromonas sp. TaxID=159274 RepID=UPI00261C96F7|nr:restriction endonuclease subunit S [uncultured Porphyromonas sp.]